MCGIVGIVYRDKAERIPQHTIEKMCKIIEHRGPDDTGIWCEDKVGLGMTRLSIIDLACGDQPIHNEDKTKWIIFNGEIYNYRILRKELEACGHKFYTRSDTETILHLYEEYGKDCVNHLRGMFAFAIWDKKKEQLFMARDRVGIKPLHYMCDGKKIVFGSEIKSILSFEGYEKEVNYQSIVNYFAYGYVPDPETMYNNINKLPPGHTLLFEKGSLSINKYWDVNYSVETVNSEEFYVNKILEILNESVKIRLMSEVPLGGFLSGGIDSSMVVALMAKNMSNPVKTFSIGFKNQKYNELKYARMVAKRYGTDHHEEIVDPDSDSTILDIVRQFDEPFADSSAIPTYFVSKMAKKNVTVTLSGDGGDELFGGYERYLIGPIAKYVDYLPLKFRKNIFLNLSKIMPEKFYGINTLRYMGIENYERYIRSITQNISIIYKKVFDETFSERVDTIDPSKVAFNHVSPLSNMDQITMRQYLDIKTYLPGDILTKVDRTSMMVSLEARVPFLDHKLVEFAATIPQKFKIKNNITKYILKKAAEKLLPHELIYRPKMGFAIPIGDWLKNEWFDMSQELVLSNQTVSRGIFKSKFLEQIMSDHSSGRRDQSGIIWKIMVLELWFREIMGV